MRVFVSFACPPELMPVAERYQALVQVPGARIVDPNGLHVTVIPPWDEKDPDAVLRDFAAISSPPAEVVFDEVGYRHSRDGQSLLLLQGNATPEVERLLLQAWRALWSQDPPRPAYPHVTLARFAIGNKLPELPVFDPVTTILDRLCLYESMGGLKYRVLGEKRFK